VSPLEIGRADDFIKKDAQEKSLPDVFPQQLARMVSQIIGTMADWRISVYFVRDIAAHVSSD
jgi:hypothetical protein